VSHSGLMSANRPIAVAPPNGHYLNVAGRTKLILLAALFGSCIALGSSLLTVLIVTHRATPKVVGGPFSAPKDAEQRFFERSDRDVADAALGDANKSAQIVLDLENACARLGGQIEAYTACRLQADFWAQVDAENGSMLGSSIMGNDLDYRNDCFSKARAVFWYKKMIQRSGGDAYLPRAVAADEKFVNEHCRASR
jgi:hypothetical protein